MTCNGSTRITSDKESEYEIHVHVKQEIAVYSTSLNVGFEPKTVHEIEVYVYWTLAPSATPLDCLTAVALVSHRGCHLNTLRL